MSLYTNLVADVPKVESEFLKERQMLSEARYTLTIFVAKLQKEYEQVKEHLKLADTKRDLLYKLKETWRTQASPAVSKEELTRVSAGLARARVKQNELACKLKAFDNDEAPCHIVLLMHLNAYLKAHTREESTTPITAELST
jgi:hypothetical protein